MHPTSVWRAALIALAAIATLGPGPAFGLDFDRARALNNQGFAEYRAKNYDRAAELFRKAIEADPKHKLANYNLACVMALRAYSYCHLEMVLGQLKQAMRVDPNAARKAHKDPDFKAVRDSIEFWVVLGDHFEDPKLVKRMLVGTLWGPYGEGEFSQASFDDDGTFDLKGETPQGTEYERSGAYQIAKDGTVTLRFEGGGLSSFRISHVGTITVKDKKGYTTFRSMARCMDSGGDPGQEDD